MTPAAAVQIAQAVYSAAPHIGDENTAARATRYPPDALAFPGSNNFACWLADLDAGAIPVAGLGRVHQGFWRAWCEIRQHVLALPYVATTIGHSEGAALAILAAADLCAAGRPPAAVYAFEPPRVSADGTIGALLAAHGVALHLYRNGNDVVPIVPRVLEPWQHPGPLTQVGVPSHPFPNVEDHLMQNVVRGVLAA